MPKAKRKVKRPEIEIVGWLRASHVSEHPFAYQITVSLDRAGSVEKGQTERFSVTYGKQVMRDLDYRRASYELGRSIMHALFCDSAFGEEL